MAVAIPVMFLLVLGGFQVFRFYAMANNIELAVMEGARSGLLASNTPEQAIATAQICLNRAGIQNTAVDQSTKTNPLFLCLPPTSQHEQLINCVAPWVKTPKFRMPGSS